MKDAVIAEKSVVEELRRINVLPEVIKIMEDRSVFRILRLGDIKAPMANMIKQEMLAAGGEAAVHSESITYKVKSTDVLMFGTREQYKKFIESMSVQPYEAKRIAMRVKRLLWTKK